MQKGSFKEDFDDWVSSDAESEIKIPVVKVRKLDYHIKTDRVVLPVTD